MKTFRNITLLCLGILAGGFAQGATVIIGDTYNVTGSGSGFGLNAGLNTGINPPTTRLTGTLASGLRYMNTGAKATTAYTITSNKARIAAAANAGRFTLSANGSSFFDFAPGLGISGATAATPVVYDLAVSIDNDSTGTYRTSFAIGTAEGDATTWDFGIQLYRAASGNNYYTIGKRIDTGSSGLASDLNEAIHTMAASTYGTEVAFLIRVTDAGSESTTYNSRVQVSLNGGTSWIYDTDTDSDLAGTGFRFNGAARCIMWDVAPNAGNVTYDNFSVNWISGPRTWTGAGANGNWSTSGNWGGVVPVSGGMLNFSGTTRQTSTNDLSGLTVPSLTFNNGGFSLYGNAWTASSAITNLAGNNTLKGGLAWSSTGAKNWSIGNGSELILDNTTSVEVNGTHTIHDGGTLRLKGTMNIGQATSANPAFVINQGQHIVEGGTFNSRGDYRIGSLATGSGAQAILTNGATLNLTATTAGVRVGDSANTVASRLVIDNSTLSAAGVNVGIPYATGAIGEVSQKGGSVTGAILNFNQAGAGTGTYTVENGTVEVLQIKKTTAGGLSTINLNNAILRPATGASNAFFSGLNVAAIQSGGVTVDATANVVIAQALSGSGALTKTGTGTVTLSGANTYSGDTTIAAGTLALGVGGSIASPAITIANGTTLDVSALSGYAVGAGQTLVRNATSGTGTINGSVTLTSGATVSLQLDGAGGTVGTLSIAGDLTANGNTLAINVTGSALGVGTYPLISYTGSKSGSFNAAPAISGSGLAPGMAATIVESAGQIQLNVYVPARIWSGNGANSLWSVGANWAGAAPSSGDRLIFNGTNRQANTNDISGLSIPWVTFNNGGFALYGNPVTVNGAITNLSGNNAFKANLAFDSTGAKVWQIASGSEVQLDNATTVDVGGDHHLNGGGTLRVTGSAAIGQASTANPAFILNAGNHIVDGGSFASRGGYRIGSLATGLGAQTIVSNGATFSLTASGANLRVGDSANPVESQLVVHNSSLTMAGGVLAVPFAAGASGSVTQTGGTVSGGIVSFSEAGAGTGTYTVKDGILQPIQIVEGNSSGSSTISFDNATLRAVSGANSAFMTGLNVAQIQAGGLTVEASADVVIGQVLSGSGALTKTGTSKVTLGGANTYSGATTINAGTLAVGTGGAIASATITIANGTTFDVSAAGYTVSGTQTIVRNATSGVGTVNGTITFASGGKVSLQANGSTPTFGTLNVTGGLNLNGNTISIDVAGAQLGEGTYPLITYTGAKSGSFNVTPTITGLGIETGLLAKIVETSGQISLNVYVPPTPPHGVAAANIKVVQHDLANTVDSVTVTTTLSINGFQIRDGSNRGDINVQIGSSATDEVNTGVMMTSVSENGRDHGEESGINYCTSAMAYSRSGANGGSFFIPVSNAPEGQEYNINVSAAFFPFTNWLAGHARNSTDVNGGANNLFTGSSGLALGTHFVDNGGGISTVNLTSLGINSTTDGILLVNHARNEANRATSVANANGTWTIHVRDNGTNGAATEQDPVAFVYVPKSNNSVISGKFQGDGGILMHSGTTPKFSVVNTATGTWTLTIPGQTPSTGVLVISPEGGDNVTQDNTISYQPSGSSWIIQSRDIPGMGLQTPAGPVASFAFIPAPTATLVSPANNAANIASSPTLKVAVVNPAGGNAKVTFHGHQAPKPYPGKDFMIAVLPDTQNYAREESGYGQATKEMWFSQTDWIANNRVSENIAYVATLGDCVQNADQLWQWKNATNAMYRLEKQSTTKLVDGVPYGVTVGNHDQSPIGEEDGDTTYYNQFFGTSHFQNKAYYGGHYGSNNDNWYDLFSAGDLDFLVISFEYGRFGDAVLDWAESVITAHPNRRVIVLTHHAGDDNADVNATTTPHSTQGAAIYERLKHHSKFFLMMGGHVFNEGGEGRRTDTFNGNTVRTLVSDYQNRMNGGNGWMRLMYFSPSNNVVTVKTYSPHLNTWETDANSQFTFNYNMQPNGAGSPGTAYVNVGTNLNVAPGAQASVVWSGLQASKTYEWYVTVADAAGDYSTSSEWKFTTTAGFAPFMAGDTDSNENGISDNWEAQYSITDADADADGDGQSNRAEYLAKTDPTNAQSLLKILSAEPQADGKIKLTWTSVEGVRYRIQYTDDLTAFADLPEVIGEMSVSSSGGAATQSITDSSINGNPTNNARFYRVKVVTD